jgi:WhiB family redox-sensing transcriptional regulator
MSTLVPEFLADPHADPLCAETDPEAFFPDPDESPEPARDICKSCELRDPCLAWALSRDEHGVWGATTRHERRRIKEGWAITERPPAPRRRSHTRVGPETHDQVIELTIRGWTLEDIAREVGVSPRTVLRIRARERDAA